MKSDLKFTVNIDSKRALKDFAKVQKAIEKLNETLFSLEDIEINFNIVEKKTTFWQKKYFLKKKK